MAWVLAWLPTDFAAPDPGGADRRVATGALMAVATDVSGLLDGRLTIGVWDGPDEMVLVVGGDLDLASAPQLTAALARVLRGGPGPRVVLDLEGVGFMDAAGLGCIVRAGHRLAGRGGALAVRRPSRPARRLLELCGLGALLR